MGATIVDSLDTLYIMGMTEEFTKAKKWVEANLDMSKMVNTARVVFIWTRYYTGLKVLLHQRFC